MRLLIIEDSPRLRATLNTGFSNLGYIVETSGDGREGLCLARDGHFDVIILDIMLPSMDGLSVLRALRDRRVKTPVVILSARDAIQSRIKGLDLGADDYLCKPFAFEELEARVRNQVRKTHGMPTTTLDFGALQIKAASKLATIDSRPLLLTPNEYLLLEAIALGQGRLITYEALERALDRGKNPVSRNSIEAHVSALRKKLRREGVEDLIKTRRGFGYYVEQSASVD